MNNNKEWEFMQQDDKQHSDYKDKLYKAQNAMLEGMNRNELNEIKLYTDFQYMVKFVDKLIKSSNEVINDD
jgi:hypothetical protein